MGKIICIAGPTASGKTALSIALAKKIDAQIVSCDSMQVYRYMDIGTAKPTAEEMQGVAHHMLSVADPREDFSVSRYCEMASAAVDSILRQGQNVIIAGGTGLYMDALIRGNSFAPYPSTGRREELEQLAREKGIGAVIEMLERVDPESAQRLHPSDQKRIIRAMEVYLETGHTITEHNKMTQAIPPKYEAIWFALEDVPRQTLYDRIDRRVDQMLEQGLIDEIRQLLQQGINENCTAMQAIGYKEFLAALRGECSIDQAADQVRQASRRYAKRQLTWFRRNPAIHWLRRYSQTTAEEILLQAHEILTQYNK